MNDGPNPDDPIPTDPVTAAPAEPTVYVPPGVPILGPQEPGYVEAIHGPLGEAHNAAVGGGDPED